MKLVKKINTAARSKSETIQEIDSKIECLELCVKQMKGALKRKDGGEIAKYALKEIIPFNWIFRAIKKSDKIAVYSWAACLAGNLIGLWPIAGVICRTSGWPEMIKAQIQYTEESIEYLKSEKEKLKKNIK